MPNYLGLTRTDEGAAVAVRAAAHGLVVISVDDGNGYEASVTLTDAEVGHVCSDLMEARDQGDL